MPCTCGGAKERGCESTAGATARYVKMLRMLPCQVVLCNSPSVTDTTGIDAAFWPAVGSDLSADQMLCCPMLCSCRYELCSWYGLYVIDEANLETHGFDPTFVHDANHPAHHAMWFPAIMSRVTRMFERDKNAACVIMWSLGNEAGYGAAHNAAAAWLRRQDSSRPVHYEVGSD
jgi:hypothetical protein